jgi:hypothetical protein
MPNPYRPHSKRWQDYEARFNAFTSADRYAHFRNFVLNLIYQAEDENRLITPDELRKLLQKDDRHQ